MNSYQLFRLDELRLVGMSIQTTKADAREDVPALWQKVNFAKRNGRFPEGCQQTGYGFYYDFKPNGTCRYFAGFANPEPPLSVLMSEELEVPLVKGHNYTVYELDGYFPDLLFSFQDWLERVDHQSLPGHPDLEVYPEGCKPWQKMRMELWLSNHEAAAKPIAEQLMNLPDGVKSLSYLVAKTLMAA